MLNLNLLSLYCTFPTVPSCFPTSVSRTHPPSSLIFHLYPYSSHDHQIQRWHEASKNPSHLQASLTHSTCCHSKILCVRTYLFYPGSKDKEWRSAMSQEFTALLHNGTWTLVPPHHRMNIIGCKWIFKIKRKADGSIERYKARLVAKGFNQQEGLDFIETFSPVVKPTTVRLVFSIALSQGWPIRQLDGHNAFLHGYLNEEVYMSQPAGFVYPHQPNHVCRLHKSIYGLKQAPRAWFARLSSFLLEHAFTGSKTDSSLFIFNHHGIIIYILIYVDDIIVTGNSPKAITTFFAKIAKNLCH